MSRAIGRLAISAAALYVGAHTLLLTYNELTGNHVGPDQALRDLARFAASIWRSIP